MTTPDESDDVVLDEGDLFVYDDQDLSQIAAEVFARLREHDDLDDTDAEEAASMVYDLMTGEWQADLHDQ